MSDWPEARKRLESFLVALERSPYWKIEREILPNLAGDIRLAISRADAVGALEAEKATVWLVWASQGEYSDRSEWPVCAFWSEQAAKDDCLRRLFAWRAADAVGRDEDGQTPDYNTPEDKAQRAAFEALASGSGLNSYSGEPSYYACEIDVLAALSPAPSAQEAKP